jgi:hypothetical protein
MLSLFLKSLLGAAAVLIIALFSKSKTFYIAGKRRGSAAPNGAVWDVVADPVLCLSAAGLFSGGKNALMELSGRSGVGLDGGRCGADLSVAAVLNPLLGYTLLRGLAGLTE